MQTMESSRKRRVNGLERPYAPPQLSTWVFLPTLVLEFCFLASPLMPIGASIPVTLVVFGFAAAATYFGYRTMAVDPADPRLLFRGEEGQGIQQDDPTKQCWICDVQVHEQSMHCKFCNKCVDHFDHHCMWMNTCIGKKNYHLFYRTLLSIIGFLVVHCAVQLALIVDTYANTSGSTNQLSHEWFGVGESGTLGLAIGMGIFCLADVIALSLMMQLWMFHLRLQREGLSTYKFIVKDNQRRREARATSEDLERKRTTAMAKALAEKRKADYFRLKFGGALSQKCGFQCCDPLQAKPTKQAQGDTQTNGDENGEEATEP